MKSTRILAVALMAMLAFAACKDKDDDPAPKTKKEMLTAGKWQVTAQVEKTDSAGVITTRDAYAEDFEACDKDDFITFGNDGIFTADDGPTKCNASDPQTYTGTWELKDNDSKLKLDEDGFEMTFDINELSDNKLEIKFSDTYEDITETITVTYSRI